MTRELLAVPMRAAVSANEVYSGVARMAGTLWCTRHRSDAGKNARTAVVVVHPASNFMGHYSLTAFAEAGVDAIGMTTRYIGNDTALLLENCVVDVGAVIAHLREVEGYERVVLFGNSGGGGLAALYQNQAENTTITSSPCGGGPDLTKAELPCADALVLAMAHPGRAQLLTEWLDPAVRDEHNPFDRDAALDMFDPANGPAYSAEFLARYRKAQIERSDRITEWAVKKLAEVIEQGIHDYPFVVHGVAAEPRFLDLTLDPSDREVGTLWGDAWNANIQPAVLGHYTTCRSWLSQWSYATSNGDGPARLKTVKAPVHVVYGTADQGCFPAHAKLLYESVPHDRKVLTAVKGGKHYLNGQPEQTRDMVRTLVDWFEGV
jgi:pimeloyl-ACP methyl ester carboxylesterase